MKVATVCVCASLLKIEGEHHPLCPCAPSADEIICSVGNNVAYVRDGLIYTVTSTWRLHDTEADARAEITALKAQRNVGMSWHYLQESEAGSRAPSCSDTAPRTRAQKRIAAQIG